jgi:hypothetical protein
MEAMQSVDTVMQRDTQTTLQHFIDSRKRLKTIDERLTALTHVPVPNVHFIPTNFIAAVGVDAGCVGSIVV